MDPENVLSGVLAAAAIKVIDYLMSRRGRKEIRRELLQDEGENGEATIKRTLREIQQDVRDTRRLASDVAHRFDSLDEKVDELGGRVSRLEYVTGLRTGR